MKINKSIIVQPQVRKEWWLQTQHPEHPEHVGSWVYFRAWIDKDISKISNEVKSQKILSNIRNISERTGVFRSIWNLLDLSWQFDP